MLRLSDVSLPRFDEYVLLILQRFRAWLPGSFRLQSQVSCDLCQSAQQRLILVVVVQMIGILSSPYEVAIPAQEGNEHRIEIPALVRPMMAVGAGSGAEDATTSVTSENVFSDSIPAFGL